MGYRLTLLLLGSFSLPFVLPLSTLHPLGKTAHHETTAAKWHCYNGQFVHATPGHSLQAPCLRFISPTPGAPAGGTGIQAVRIQVDAGTMSAENIQLRWVIIAPASQQGGREESVPVQECRNKMSCDTYVPPNGQNDGNPVVMVTGSYESTPWMNTTIRVFVQEQGEEVPLLLPRQPQQYQASQHQVSQEPRLKAPHPSRQDSYKKSASKNEGGPSESWDNAHMRQGGDLQNYVKSLIITAPLSPSVQRVRSRRNNSTPPKYVRTTSTLPRWARQVQKGRISSKKWQHGGERTLQPQNPPKRKRRKRPHGQMRRRVRPIQQKHLSGHPNNPNMAHQRAGSRPTRGLPSYSKQSSRHLPQRMGNQQVNRAQIFGYQPSAQRNHGAVRQQTVPGTRQGHGQQTTSDVRSHRTGLQPLHSWREHSIQPSSPSNNGNYQQRIQSEFSTLQRLQSNWQHEEEQHHRMKERVKSHEQNRAHEGRLLEKLQNLRADHLTRLNHISPGVRHPHERLSPTPWRKGFLDTPTRKPQRVVPNYYPIIPHVKVQQEHGTTSPNAHTTAQVTATMAPTTLSPTTTYVTTTAAPTTEAPTTANPTTTTKSPVRGRPLSNRERMRNDRKMYQGLQSRDQREASNRPRSAANHGRRDNNAYERQSYTYREDRPIPVASEYEPDPASEGALPMVDTDEGHSDYDSVDIRDWIEDRDEASHENLPESPNYEESRLRVSQVENVFNDELQSKTPRRENLPDDIEESSTRESWEEYSDLLPAYYDEIEDEVGENNFNDISGIADDEDEADQIYDTSVSMDTWGESKSVRSKPDQSTVDETDRRMSVVYDTLTKQHNLQRYMDQLDMPFNEQTFRALQEEIINEEQRDPVNQQDNQYSAESFGLRRNVPRHFKQIESLSNNEQLPESSDYGRELRDKAGHGRVSRTVNEGSAFETSASEPKEYSYNPSSDLPEQDLAPGHTEGDIDGMPLGEETLRAVQTEILAEERVSQQVNGGRLSNGQSNGNRGRKDITNSPLWRNDRIRPVDRYEDDNMDYNPVSIAKEDMGWSEWSQCSHTCGHGTKTRHRACTRLNTSTCSSGVESRVVKCALERCSEDWKGSAARDVAEEESLSEWRDWSGWSPCSVSCGNGYSHRERTCLEEWDRELRCLGQREEIRTCRLNDCNGYRGGMSRVGATRHSDHGHHTKRIKCHLDDSRTHLPMELFWTSPSGEKITHAMTHERNSKYRIEGSTLVVTEDQPVEGSYHCIVVYGGNSGTHNKGKTGSTASGCYSSPCHHKGICLDQPGHIVSFRCMCPAGYEGTRCHMAPYLEGDVIVLSLLGWFVVSSSVAIIIICLCCSKQMKKKKMKQKLDLDDAPAEKLLAKILPHIDTTHNTDSDEDEDTKLLLGLRPPKAKVAFKPQVQNIRPKEAAGKPKKTGMFKTFVEKVIDTFGKDVKEVAMPTSQKWKTLTRELNMQRNRNNSNTLDSSRSEVDSLDSDTTMDSSFESLPEGGDIEGCSQFVNHNMNNCSWDYSNVSSCAPHDLNSSSIVGNDDDYCHEISTDDFRDFQVANAFSVFKGSPSTQGNQAMIDPLLVYENTSSAPARSTSWPEKVPQGTGTHPMFHFEPTAQTSTSTSNSFTERHNNNGVGCRSASGTTSWRGERPWPMSTPPRRGTGVRVRLPPSPSLSVSPSRLKLPPSPTRQRASCMFGLSEEHEILEQYRERRTTHPKHAKSHVTFDTNPQETLDAHFGTGECNANGTPSATPSIRSVRDSSGAYGTCYRDNNARSSSGPLKRQENSVATRSDDLQDATETCTGAAEKSSRQTLEANRNVFGRHGSCESSARFSDHSAIPVKQDMHQPFSLDKSCTTSSNCGSV